MTERPAFVAPGVRVNLRGIAKAGPATLGVRAEDTTVRSCCAHARGTIARVEDIGADRFVYVEVGNTRLVLRTTEAETRSAEIGVRFGQVHVFVDG